MPETTTLIAPATAAWKTPVEPLFEPVRLGRYDLPHCMVMASLTRSRAPQPAMFLQDYGGAAETASSRSRKFRRSRFGNFGRPPPPTQGSQLS